MINREEYFEQIKKSNLQEKVELNKFEHLFNLYEDNINKKKQDIKISGEELGVIDEIIEGLFGIYGSQPLLPYDFLETPIGHVILSVKYELIMPKNKIYYVDEVAKILGVTEQSIHNKIKKGEIKASKPKREWHIYESDLKKYMNSIGQSFEFYNTEKECLINEGVKTS